MLLSSVQVAQSYLEKVQDVELEQARPLFEQVKEVDGTEPIATAVVDVQVLLKYPAIVWHSAKVAPDQLIALQVLADEELPPVHVYPLSTVHVDEQPSPDEVLLSSQASVPVFFPSPHF